MSADQIDLTDPKVRDRLAWSLWAHRYNDRWHSWSRAAKGEWYRQADFILSQLREFAR